MHFLNSSCVEQYPFRQCSLSGVNMSRDSYVADLSYIFEFLKIHN